MKVMKAGLFPFKNAWYKREEFLKATVYLVGTP
jgi:hypothetical protein